MVSGAILRVGILYWGHIRAPRYSPYVGSVSFWITTNIDCSSHEPPSKLVSGKLYG